MIAIVKTQNGGPLNLRQSTSTSSSILAQIPNGAKLEVAKVNENWYQTTYNSKTGFIVSKYIVESTGNVDKTQLQAVYESLKNTLTLIESVLK